MLYGGSASPTEPHRTAAEEAVAHFRAAAAAGSRLCHYNVGALHLRGTPHAAASRELLLQELRLLLRVRFEAVLGDFLQVAHKVWRAVHVKVGQRLVLVGRVHRRVADGKEAAAACRAALLLRAKIHEVSCLPSSCGFWK